MKTVREEGNRKQYLDKLAESGRIDLFWKIINTLLLMEDRRISQVEVAEAADRSPKWVETTLTAHPKLSHQQLEVNIEIIDDAVTEITDRRNM